MKKLSIHFLILIIFVFVFNNLSARELKLGIFDSAHLDEFHYQPFIDIAKSVDFNVDYKSFAKIADSTLEEINLDQYDGIIFVLGIEFFKNFFQFLQGRNKGLLTAVSDKFLHIIETFGEKPNKLMGFAFPPGGNAIAFLHILMGVGLKPITNEIIQSFGFLKEGNVEIPHELAPQLNELFANSVNFLNIPMEKRSYMYDTTLMPPLNQRFPKGQQIPSQMQGALNKLKKSRQTLPLRPSLSLASVLEPTLPYGIYWFNPRSENHLFITSSTVLSFAGIAENYFVCPDNADLRRQMLGQVQEMMLELNVILSNENLKGNYQEAIKVINENQKPDLPLVVRAMGMKKENKLLPETYDIDNNFLRGIGWTELHHFYDKPGVDPKVVEKQRDFFIECALKSGINALWFDFDPQVYYSPIGIANNEIKKEEFWKAVSLFTQKLSVKAKMLKKTPPKIFVGYQIVNNIRDENLPKSPAKDLYGNVYEDVPQPLDKSFWEEEIKKPLIPFLEKWNDTEISHGIKISGVVLDLEMYNRAKSQTGAFLATMGFGKETFEKFPDAQLLGIGSLQENIQNLVMNSRMQAYFNYLEEQAEEIGRDLREFFRDQIPNCDIGCYAINMGMDWFYKGFYRGLGTKEKPLQLLTFNSEFDTFKSWLNRNKIYVNHSSVLMLSKIRSTEDFWRVNYILDRNNGVWINKFQRLAEDFNRGVWLEWSPMTWEPRLEFCDYLYQYFIQEYVDVMIKTLQKIYPPEILIPTK